MTTTEGRSRKLCTGDTVELERADGEALAGVVTAVSEDGVDVMVQAAVSEGEVLSVSRTIRDDARYTAAMEVVEADAGRFRVRLVGDWKRMQMRQFVRVSVYGVGVDVRPDRPADESERDRKRRLQRHRRRGEERPPRLLDLSAGGLRFEARREFARGDTLELEFSLPESGPVVVRGQVVRADGPCPDAGGTDADPGPSQYGIRFLDMDESIRVRIMTWVFAEQARRFRESKKRTDG
jgi:hypothetical protein